MWPDRVSNSGPLAFESDALPTRGPAVCVCVCGGGVCGGGGVGNLYSHVSGGKIYFKNHSHFSGGKNYYMLKYKNMLLPRENAFWLLD